MSCRSILILSATVLVVLNDPGRGTVRGRRMLADRPLAVMYAKDINERSVLNYVQGMLKRLTIGKTISGHISQQLAKTVGTKALTPFVGQRIYLVQ